MNRNDEY
ncbi:hypothetical protein VCHENC02_2154, partial [Vibrio harveyi]